MPYVLLGIALLLAGLQLRVLWAARRLRGQAVPEAGDGRQVFYFHSPSCGPCRALTPMVHRLAAEQAGLRAVDVVQEFDLARRFGVMATPTFVVTENGHIKEVLVGGMTEARLRALVAKPC